MAITRKLAGTYEHVQDTPATEWVIVHNLGMYPIVDAYVLHEGEYRKIMPMGVTYDNENQCTIEFSVARDGYAMVV